MSSYLHEVRKFSDLGLQLRFPVDLIPTGQFSRLTNAIPIIEGELRTRDGLILIGIPTEISFAYQLARDNVGVTTVTTISTPYACGYRIGDVVGVNVIALSAGELSTIPLQAYTGQTVTAVASDQLSFTISPGFPATWSGVNLTMLVFAEVASTSQTNNLPSSLITNIYRLNEAILNVASERLVAIAGRLWHQALPNGSFEEIVGTLAPGCITPQTQTGFSGRPLSIISFRFTLDTQTWAIFADQSAMFKYRSAPTLTGIEFAPLGNQPPTAPALASAGIAGNLNSTGGTGYDWRYTYVDGLAKTESNPSPINMSSGGVVITRPLTFTNPAVAGQTAFTNPANAIDASSTTGSVGTRSNSSSGGGSSLVASCSWQGWNAAAGVVDSNRLNIILSITGSASTSGTGFAQVSVNVSYSYDAGATFYTVRSLTGTSTGGSPATINNPKALFQVGVPSSASLTNMIVKATVIATASGGSSGHANATGTITVFDIRTEVVEEGSTNVLALVNQQGNVCVQPSPLPQQTFINLYRRGGSLTDTWRLVGQFQESALSAGPCVSGALEIIDNVSDTTLSTSAIIQFDNDQPVTSVNSDNQPLPFIWGPAGVEARVLGCGDPARPESVYFSKPGNADAWPPQNHVEVCDPGTPVIAGCVFNTRNFAFSRESIYELVEGLGTGTTYTPFRTPSARGLFTPWGLATGPAMYFISKDGVYESTGGQEQSLVENDIKPLFPTYDSPGQDVEQYEAIDYTQPDAMRLRYHNNELYFIYAGLTTKALQMLIYDVYKRRWRASTSTARMSEVYSEPATVSSLLQGSDAGVVYRTGGDHDPTELNLLLGPGVTVTAIATTFSADTYNARVVALSASGPVSMGYDVQGLVVGPAIGMSVVFPAAQPGVVEWRVYFGPNTAIENQYVSYTESFIAAQVGRVVTITGNEPPVAGAPPTANASSNIAVNIRTGAHDQGAPLNKKQYGNVIFDLDPGGATPAAPVTITPYINGEVQANAAITVTGTGRQQVPLNLTDYFAFNTEYEISWERTDVGGGVVTDPVLFQYDTLHFLEPAELKHWQSQPSSFGFPGFMHCRDAYIAIRSNAAVTLKITFDTGNGTESTQTYTLPSTAGARLKQYVQFFSNKGLLYRFTLDSEQPFRTYETDLEVRVKPFLGLLGYSVQKPLGGEVSS